MSLYRVYKDSSISIWDKQFGLVPAEVYFMRKIQDHPAAITFFYYHKLSEDNFIIITERPANSNDLLELARDDLLPLSEDLTREIVRQVASVLKAMEKKRFVHKNVKLDNILYDYDSHDVKLIDFGVARKFKPLQ